MHEPKPRILVVDDDLGIIRIISETLKEKGDIFFATDGTSAIRMVSESSYDLMLLDAQMPGMDGYEVCTQIKADPKTADLPVIFITADLSLENEARALELGAVDFITKPFNPLVMQARVQTHLTLKRQADLLRRLATIDGLTGIANRRRFNEAMEYEWKRAMRQSTALSVMMIDIDHFKAFNDRYGHLAGDDCLVAVAACLNNLVHRPGDLVARYGGEEFVVLLPDTAAPDAQMLANSMRQAVADTAIYYQDALLQGVTLSIGIATTVPDTPEATVMMAAADRALYQAKTAGRNRVVVAEPA